VLLNPSTNTYNIDRAMEIIVTVSPTGSIASVLIVNPKEKFNKNDTFKILGGNSDATFRLTEQPIPYFWQKDGKRVVIPESNAGAGWCLPPVDESIKCNPYTSDSILVQKIDDKGKITYAWGCYCKQPSFMQHEDTPISNCSALVGCGGFDLYVPTSTSATCTSNAMCTAPNSKCCNDDKCLKGTETFGALSSGRCYTKWITGDTQLNPKNGTCDCPNNMYYSSTAIGDYVVKTCGVDPCEPGGTFNPQTRLCECKTGYVSCGLTESSNVVVTDARCATTNTLNRCIEDPCAPGGKTRNLVNGGCECDRTQNYVEKIDVNVPGGKFCKQLCVNNGSCGSRGTCAIENDNEVCRNCVCPWMSANSSDKLCSKTTGQGTEGQVCEYETRMEGPLLGKYPVTYPIDASCCSPLKCRFREGSSVPYCTKV
jgi:hypothetical protein